MSKLPANGLYIITDCVTLSGEILLHKTRVILANGASMLQYRNKQHDPELAKSIQDLCKQFNVPFIINDNVELAGMLKADGVHLGKDDPDCKSARAILGSSAIIGVSCYNQLTLAQAAEADGADYVAFGAFFPTNSKTDTVTADISLLTQAQQQLPVPIVAIGGICPDNGELLISAGANFLAVISNIYHAEDTAAATRKMVKLFDNTKNKYDE